jgi:hypothetical protein
LAADRLLQHAQRARQHAIGCSVAKSPISFTSSAAAWPLTSTLTAGQRSRRRAFV